MTAPFASADTRFSNVLRNSGAASALLPYRMHGAGVGDAGGTSPATAAANAVTGITIVGGNVVVTYGDGSTENVPLPAAVGGVTVVNVQRMNDDVTVTYSDGTTATFSLGTGSIRWPGL